jgi:hypothetical protein
MPHAPYVPCPPFPMPRCQEVVPRHCARRLAQLPRSPCSPTISHVPIPRSRRDRTARNDNRDRTVLVSPSHRSGFRNSMPWTGEGRGGSSVASLEIVTIAHFAALFCGASLLRVSSPTTTKGWCYCTHCTAVSRYVEFPLVVFIYPWCSFAWP